MLQVNKSITFFIDPYVKILMLNGKTGRKMQKQKTKFLRGTTQPEFNETLTFDLPFHQLDTIQFLIILCSKVCKIIKNHTRLGKYQKSNKHNNFSLNTGDN